MTLIPEQSEYSIHLGDCIPHMAEMPESSVDFSIFSPPFPSLFCYTSDEADIGNSNNVRHESRLHLSFFFHQLVRVIKPGRCVIVHVMQIPGLARNNEKGTVDFRGLVIRLARRAGFIYQYDWLVCKNPQSQAIRTHLHKLLFVTLERDRAKTSGAFGDYLIKLVAPGDNEVPIDSSEITREQWIDWAEAAWPWRRIREAATLNTGEAKSEDDVKHICPLQLPVIDRCVKLFSNPGELVFSPFAGIGSEGYGALLLGRRFYGCELKPEYHACALKNCDRAIAERMESQRTLWDLAESDDASCAQDLSKLNVGEQSL